MGVSKTPRPGPNPGGPANDMSDSETLVRPELPAEPVTVEEVLQVELLKDSGVRLWRIEPGALIEFLHGVHDRKVPQVLDGCIATCVGGMFRSSMINELLARLGVDMPLAKSEDGTNPGVDMGSLLEKIRHGQIDDEGGLIPEGFKAPVRKLLVGVNMRSSEMDNLDLLLMGIARRAERASRRVDLEVIIVDTRDEDDITAPGRVLRDLIDDEGE